LPRNISKINSLVKVRKMLEDQRRVELAQLREKEYMAVEKLSSLRTEKKRSQSQLGENKGNTALYLSYLDNLSERLSSQSILIKELRVEIEEARQLLLQSSKSRKVVEKLLDREIKNYMQNMIIQERKHLDEIASIRFMKSNIL